MPPPNVESVEDAVERLEAGPDPERRHRDGAAGWEGWTAAVEPLVDRLVAGEERTRGRAATALGWVGDEAAVDPLVGRLRADGSDRVRERAAVALGEIGDADAADALAAALETEPNASVRRAVAGALVACGEVETAAEVVERHDGPDREATVRQVVRAMADGDRERARARAAAVEFLLTGAPLHRRVAAECLDPGDDDARSALVAALDDADPEVRAATATTLGEWLRGGNTDDGSTLWRLLAHVGRRAVGLDVDGTPDATGDSRVRSALVDALDDDDPRVRRAVVEALAAATDRRAVERRLRDVAGSDSDESVRRAAARAVDRDGNGRGK
ncbi:hypothetical protein BRD13_00430 [Halobacteriales archaeon SW_5_70_135]|nr:MAG: hypothetical protein BRD13_00430 [Halobacteriales archaeon SW_5_70_135]